MEFLAFSDFDEQFGFIDDLEECVDDFTKPKFIYLSDLELSSIRFALSLAEDDLYLSLSHITESDILSKSDLSYIFSVVVDFLEKTRPLDKDSW